MIRNPHSLVLLLYALKLNFFIIACFLYIKEDYWQILKKDKYKRA
ncbi:hypothetical protein FM106_06575 [Brachybacterium faecium]|nr:hypothetical protein FM106_06575 [Brachybacterium faecium]